MPGEITLHDRRRRALPEAGGHSLFCTVTRRGGANDVLACPAPDRVPAFRGEEARFRVRWFSKRRLKVLVQVADKPGTAPQATAAV